MHFTLFSMIFSLFVLTTFVYSAPTSSLDSATATLLNNALEAQKLNAQFQLTANSTATGPCTNGDTTCVQGAIASCVNGQFDTSQGGCPATQQCFALPSVNSNGTTITCTSEKNARSIIEAAGATGGVTGSDSGGSISSASASSTLSAGTATSTDPITPTSTSPDESIVTVTVTSSVTLIASGTASASSTLSAGTATSTDPITPTTVTVTSSVTVIASGTTTLPLVTQTLSPDQVSSLLSSLLAQDDPAATTATSDGLNEPSATLSSTVTATGTDSDIPTATPDPNLPSEVLSSTVPTSTTNIPSSASSATPAIDNTTGSPTGLGSAGGGYS